MSLMVSGGLFMWPLLFCSILMVAIVAERLHLFSQILKTPLLQQEQPPAVLKKLRQHLITLHTIIVIAPLLGLLGTVTGLMRSFNLLGTQGVIDNPQQVSLGISEALITTAAGLIITVIATVFYNYLTARIEEYVMEYNTALAEAASHE